MLGNPEAFVDNEDSGLSRALGEDNTLYFDSYLTVNNDARFTALEIEDSIGTDGRTWLRNVQSSILTGGAHSRLIQGSIRGAPLGKK